MGFFISKEDIQDVLSKLWDRILADDSMVNTFSTIKIVVIFEFRDVKTNLIIDNSGEKPTYSWDSKIKGDVVMMLDSHTAHLFWSEKLNVPLALATRKVVARGSLQKALKLLPALKPAFGIYRQLLTDLNRSISEGEEKKTGKLKRKKKKSLFKIKKQKYNLEILPKFALTAGKNELEITFTESKPLTTQPKPEELLAMMYRIRFFEEHLAKEFENGNIPTEAIHLSIGQEAVAAAVCMNLRHSDYLNTTHRGHGHILGKGADVNRMMAELYGKETGLCAGKGGSMHVTDGNIGVLGANGIVGAGYLLAVGAGHSIKMQNRDDISVVIAGDGSMNQGMFHEAMNMASLFDLPVLVVVENNLYGEFTHVEKHSALSELYKRAEAYNMETIRLDGNDAVTLSEDMSKIIASIRADSKPRFVELMTYRWQGHMEGDGELYRSEEEKNLYKEKDPIKKLENELLAGGAATSFIKSLRENAGREILDAVEFTMSQPDAGAEALMIDVFTPDRPDLFMEKFPEITPGDNTRFISVSQAINEAIGEEMETDTSVFLWGEDVCLGGYFNVTDGLMERFGRDRIIDMPISENGFIGGAVGAAMTGMRPVSEILFGDFLSCCMDPILNQAAKLRYMTGGQVTVPMTIRTPVGSGVGMAAQHSQSMERFFSGIPGLIVVAPSDAYTSKGLLKSAIRSNNPVLFFEHKLLYAMTGEIPDTDYHLPLGKARVAVEGEDVTIVSWLMGVNTAKDAAVELQQAGIKVEVIDLATIYPIDYETIMASVAKTGNLIVVEEGNAVGGLGAEIIASVALAGLKMKSPPRRMAAPECPVPYARNLESMMLVTPSDIVKEVEDMFV